MEYVGIIIPIDYIICFRGVGIPPTSYDAYDSYDGKKNMDDLVGHPLSTTCHSYASDDILPELGSDFFEDLRPHLGAIQFR